MIRLRLSPFEETSPGWHHFDIYLGSSVIGWRSRGEASHYSLLFWYLPPPDLRSALSARLIDNDSLQGNDTETCSACKQILCCLLYIHRLYWRSGTSTQAVNVNKLSLWIRSAYENQESIRALKSLQQTEKTSPNLMFHPMYCMVLWVIGESIKKHNKNNTVTSYDDE